MDMNLSKLWEPVEDRGAWCAAVRGVTESWTGLSNRTTATYSHEPRSCIRAGLEANFKSEANAQHQFAMGEWK